MPYPSPPEISTSYTAQEQALGDGTLPGQELDVDLASIRASITDVINFVRGITRSDGALANGVVTQEALGAALIIGFDPPSVWATATAYTTRSIVFEGTKIYLCLVPHTSSVFATDLASSRWSLLADLTPAGGALVASNNLSDVADVGNSRSNLGLGSMATVNAGTGASDFRTNLQNDGRFQPLVAGLTSWAAITRAAGFDVFVASPTSANLRTLMTDETGTGALLFEGATPASLVLTNATGLPVAGLAASAVTTAAEGIASNNVDTQVPTSAAVKAYADSVSRDTFLTAQGIASGAGPFSFTIPSTATMIEMMIVNASLNGSGNLLVQLSTGAAYVTSGYDSASISGTGANVSSTAGLVISLGAAGALFTGIVRLRKIDGNRWIADHNGRASGNDRCNGAGDVTLAGTIDGIRLAATAGTFDGASGIVNVLHNG